MVREALEALNGRIAEFGGEASLLQTVSPSPAWEAQLIGRFNEARDAEYAEVIENVERFEDEVKREERKGRLRFAQLEDLESEWQKLQQWEGRIVGRDVFWAAGRGATEAALQRGRAALEAFTAAVMAHEESGEAHSGPPNGSA